MPPTPRNGRIAITSTMIPMPPSQCVTERHRSTPWGSDSMSVKTVAPVVVKPDIASKKAATGESRTPVNK